MDTIYSQLWFRNFREESADRLRSSEIEELEHAVQVELRCRQANESEPLNIHASLTEGQCAAR